MDPWAESDRYEQFMGRWGSRMAAAFLEWLEPGRDLRWLDVGCGTGALLSAVVAAADPSHISGVDTSAEFVAAARGRLGPEADVRVGDAQALPFANDHVDAAVSGLCLNFVPDPVVALQEMARVTRPGGVVGVYLWDYAAGMEMLRVFWDVATSLDPAIAHLDEAVRFPLCHPDALATAFSAAGLTPVAATAIDIVTDFRDFPDYWEPFLGATGPAPAYVASLDPDDRGRLATALEDAVDPSPDGSIDLTARAWATAATVAG